MSAIIDYRGKTPKKTPFGVPLITAKIVKDGHINYKQQEYIAIDDYDEWMHRGLPGPSDVVMTMEAPLGKVAQLDGRKVALAQRLITLRGSPGLLDNNFLKYLMQSEFIQCQLRARSTGTTVLGIKQSELRKIILKVPPLDEQNAIANILGSLDDKIELNREVNETLEAMARAIFKSWFVDFDPIRAKMEGCKPYGMDAKTAAPFPNSFQDSPLGKVPKGWSIKPIGDVLDLAYGKALKEDNRRPGNVPVYGSNGQVGWHNEALVEGPGIVVGRKGNPVIVTWVPTGFFPIDTTFYVVPKGTIRSMYYLFYALSLQDLASLGADSAVPGLNRNMAYMTELLEPTAEILNVFDKHIGSFCTHISSNDTQSHTLATIRDTLLPKLISGELRVPDAEKYAKEVI